MANFNKQDRDWLPTIIKQGNITTSEEKIFLQAFDEQTNFDIQQISELMVKEKKARKVSLYKVIMYPLEYPLTRILLGKEALDDKRRLHRIYKAYYKKQINYIELKKRLANFNKDC